MTAPAFARPLGVRTLEWELKAACPAEWWARLERCGGGFFHSPAAFAHSPDELVFAELSFDGEVVGVAVGAWRRCRMSRRARHVYFPTPPAMVGPAGNGVALDLLVGRLRDAGAAEVTMDSYDAAWVPRPMAGATTLGDRTEYRRSLEARPEDLLRDFAHHHRRHLRRGDKDGWQFAPVPPDQAPAVIEAVQHHAADRAATRGTPFEVTRIDTPGGLNGAPPWGTVAFGVWHGDVLLAAALIGWGGRRAFYLQGGSTPEGYDCHAAVWLHWRVMNELAERGFAIYNFGGNPASATLRDDPAHGLHRFKSGFGSALVACRGMRWTFDPTHARAHALWRWVRREPASA